MQQTFYSVEESYAVQTENERETGLVSIQSEVQKFTSTTPI
jgi:hypothetical protein